MSETEKSGAHAGAVVRLSKPLPDDIDPHSFELFVKEEVKSWGGNLEGLEVKHLEPLEAHEGVYVIDVTARFRAFGELQFLCLFECKRHGRPVERKDAQILNDKMREVGAQKGVLVSTSGFQEGAIKYCRKHGIGALHVMGDLVTYVVKILIGNDLSGK